MILTACWILLGGIVQTSVVIHLTRTNDPLVSDLPMPVRILVFITAPILLAPVIVNVYGAYLIIKKKPEKPGKDTEILNTKKLISAMKAAETRCESLPQLCTQWVAVFLSVLNWSTGAQMTGGMTPLQAISITTSTITLVLSTISRIPLSKPKQFISEHHPVGASLAPLCLFLLSGFAAGTTQLRFFGPLIVEFIALGYSYLVLNLVAMFFGIIILIVPCHNHPWRITFFLPAPLPGASSSKLQQINTF
jgi:hypothetical protein